MCPFSDDRGVDDVLANMYRGQMPREATRSCGRTTRGVELWPRLTLASGCAQVLL